MAEAAEINEEMEGIEIDKVIMIGGMAFIPRNGTFVPVPREKVDLQKDSRNRSGNGRASGELELNSDFVPLSTSSNGALEADHQHTSKTAEKSSKHTPDSLFFRRYFDHPFWTAHMEVFDSLFEFWNEMKDYGMEIGWDKKEATAQTNEAAKKWLRMRGINGGVMLGGERMGAIKQRNKVMKMKERGSGAVEKEALVEGNESTLEGKGEEVNGEHAVGHILPPQQETKKASDSKTTVEYEREKNAKKLEKKQRKADKQRAKQDSSTQNRKIVDDALANGEMNGKKQTKRPELATSKAAPASVIGAPQLGPDGQIMSNKKLKALRRAEKHHREKAAAAEAARAATQAIPEQNAPAEKSRSKKFTDTEDFVAVIPVDEVLSDLAGKPEKSNERKELEVSATTDELSSENLPAKETEKPKKKDHRASKSTADIQSSIEQAALNGADTTREPKVTGVTPPKHLLDNIEQELEKFGRPAKRPRSDSKETRSNGVATSKTYKLPESGRIPPVGVEEQDTTVATNAPGDIEMEMGDIGRQISSREKKEDEDLANRRIEEMERELKELQEQQRRYRVEHALEQKLKEARAKTQLMQQGLSRPPIITVAETQTKELENTSNEENNASRTPSESADTPVNVNPKKANGVIRSLSVTDITEVGKVSHS